MSTHAPHVQRMIAEAEQLAERVEKLGAFLFGEIFPTLHDMDQALLSTQCAAMTAYLSVLSLRIERAMRSL